MQLHRLIDHFEGDARRDDLDLRNERVAVRTPCVSIAQAAFRQSSRAISMLMRASAMMSGLAPSRASFCPNALRAAPRRHMASSARSAWPIARMQSVDASGPEPPLRDLEAASAAQHQRILGNPHVMETNVHVAVRRVVVAVDLHRPQNLNALRRGRRQQHRMARVRASVGVGQRHGDIERAARIAGPGRPPFLAVEHPLRRPRDRASIAMLVASDEATPGSVMR